MVHSQFEIVANKCMQKPMERPYMRPFLNAYTNDESMKQNKRTQAAGASLPPRAFNGEHMSHQSVDKIIQTTSSHSDSRFADSEPTIHEAEACHIMGSRFLIYDFIQLLTGAHYRDFEMEIRLFLLLSPVLISSKHLIVLLRSLAPSPGARYMISLWKKYYEGRQANPEKSHHTGNSKVSVCSIIFEAYPEEFDKRLWLNTQLDSAAKKYLERATILKAPKAPTSASLNEVHCTKLTYHKPFDFWVTNGSQDISDQLSLFWFGILRNISVFELVNYALDRNNRDRNTSPYVSRFVQTSQELMFQVEQTTSNAVFSHDQRLNMVKRWIRVAAMMYAQGNLNGVVCVVTVLQYADVQQIREVWRSLEVIYQTAWSKLQEIVSPQNHFAAYWRETKHYVDRPCIPFLGVYIEEIGRFRDQCQPASRTATKLIDCDQMMLLGHRLAGLQQFQLIEFEIPYNAEMQWQLSQQLCRTQKVDIRTPELDNSAEVTVCRS